MDHKEIIQAYVKRAKEAQKSIDHYTQEQIDRLCVAIGYEVYQDDNILKLATCAVEETGMGNISDKVLKHKNKVLGVLKDVKGAKSVGLIEEDLEKKIKKYAKPVGVVGALTPVTNPTATPASNAISILKGKNAVIFAPHPKAKLSSKMAVDFMRDGLRKVGAPLDLIQVIEEPSLELTAELMKQVNVVLATGGGPMVKAAYSSGTPAYGVGPGNSVQIIAEDCDVLDAARKVFSSKSFDNATSCSSENSVIVHESIYDAFVNELIRLGSYFVKTERSTLEEYMWITNAKGYRSINPEIIAQSAKKIADKAGIHVDDHVKVLLVEGASDIEHDFFSQEKLSPVLTVFKYTQFEEGYKILERLTNHYGTGHSCGIHTFNQSYIETLGSRMKTSRVMVNQPQAAGNGGAFFNGMPSTVSLGCGSWGGNITSENITFKHFINVTWVSEYFTPKRPTDDEIFGAYLAEVKA
ncbi:MAG: aldehyde dehydrogenase [Tenericutes bacterium GWC2_34_14]|nr:MAG: aldehyde dehydrogenase [Tenericutes bacterium GWC2_34_14]OHE33299.1 MAG: aldehyde dehydrogenase [Tenericutes bacterium GWE2_34_108]OHE36449.1 MAG: aldehyde dehydrogenase [Tenericutes bacterium GWF1_35_14]OHE37653.1 MAG: aldehyde dehydrogenase [Tenericutes bacterium GWF2_35_184]OHE45070.1 MAG: aldehyde dehydrogenase [Tenericutes bacterium RIFOXYA2_FULL_36_32]OHE45832.1 MAG: aldehyde dehydrogenase [Tenericutes bacterium RIFOXYA12_FULL_35_10]OHE49036.1 MAG: aldehyde dehydrogenase [Teneri